MIELFKKEGRSIMTFKKGDIIIKLSPRRILKQETNENLGIVTEVEVGIDNSFRRHPVEFIGIENNLIYLRDIKEDSFWRKKIVFKSIFNN